MAGPCQGEAHTVRPGQGRNPLGWGNEAAAVEGRGGQSPWLQGQPEREATLELPFTGPVTLVKHFPTQCLRTPT